MGGQLSTRVLSQSKTTARGRFVSFMRLCVSRRRLGQGSDNLSPGRSRVSLRSPGMTKAVSGTSPFNSHICDFTDAANSEKLKLHREHFFDFANHVGSGEQDDAVARFDHS